jgi:hypothetical protein
LESILTATNELTQALWYVEPNVGEIRSAKLTALAPGHCRIKTEFSAFSRGTESLVSAGLVPPSEYDRMRTPLMQGQFPFPILYGYCNVGTVIDGPKEWLGKTVFCLAPHQTVYDAPTDWLAEVLPSIPNKRAVLAANMETALNAVWTGKPGPADQIAVIGGGVVGLLVAYLCSHLPGAQVTLVDPVASRASVCQKLGVRFANNCEGLDNCDLVFHTSAHPDGLRDALSVAGREASVIELSWYGSRAVHVELGGAFHSQQLRLQSCQVGHVEASHRSRWSYQRRLTAALGLLTDPRLEALLEPAIEFSELPDALGTILGTTPSKLCQIVNYR